jgi:adenylate cyclase
MTSHRKLAAILSADVSGYSRLMADDERATIETLTTYRQIIRDHVERYGGRVVDSPGDALLAEFPSAVEALECAQAFQQQLARRNSQLAEHRQMVFRIGINLGDVVDENGTLYGDGVNIAARLEALCEAGSVCISGTVFDQVEGKVPWRFMFIGEQPVKNIPKPVRAYRLVAGAARHLPDKRHRLVVAAVGSAAVVVALGALWKLQQPKEQQSQQTQDSLLALPKGPSVAVLPFANLSGDPQQEYFADGITEEIITELTRFKDLFVIARNSTFQYKGRAVDVRAMGRDLGVRYVLEGSVRRSASAVRVTAQLVDATTGAHLWAETYERASTAENIFSVQTDITRRVVAAIGDPLGGTISIDAVLAARTKPAANLESYDCVLLARAYFESFSTEEHRRARDCLERTVGAEPGYAEAWAWLGIIYADEYLRGYAGRPKPMERSLEAAERAAQLDPGSQTARFSLARTLFYRHELERFFIEAENGVALNPNNATVLAALGLNMAYAGQWDRGVALIRKAMTLNPRHPAWYWFPIFWDSYRKKQYQNALGHAQRINMPKLYWTHHVLAAAYGQLGRQNEAQAAVSELLHLYPDFGSHARDEWRKYNVSEEFIDHALDGLRKAGLEVPSK